MDQLILERFMRFVYPEPNCGCWLWGGAAGGGKSRYGTFRVPKRKMRLAHLVSYELFVGPVLKGLHVDHKCRVTFCVNPMHLEPVTVRENHHRSPLQKASKTHCPQGHAYTPENVYLYGNNRQCRTCKQARDRGRKR